MFAVHKWAGLVTGALFFLTAASGFVLLFAEDANLRAQPRVRVGPVYAHLGPTLAEVAAAHPGYALSFVRLSPEPDLAWAALLRHPQTDDRIVADLDPYTGKVIAYRDYDSTAFRILFDLHYTYFAGPAGKVASTAVSLALIVLSITGLWIYRGAIRDVFRWRARRASSGRAALTWLHKWTGLWALGLALVWGVTGFVFMLSILPAAFGPSKRRFVPADPSSLRALPDTAALFARAREALPGGEIGTFFPGASGGSVGAPRVRVFFRQNWPWEKFGEVRFAPSGEIASVVRPESAPAGVKFNTAIVALHFGFMGHRATHVVYALGGLIMIFLPASGCAMWWLKHRRAVWALPALVTPADAAAPVGTLPDTDTVLAATCDKH